MTFDAYIGIDYSGAKTVEDRLKGLQVFIAQRGKPRRVGPPGKPEGAHWTRQQVAEWLVSQLQSRKRIIAGIDHAFSFPQAYFQRHKLESWHAFLTDFIEHWPTHLPDKTVAGIRSSGPKRTGHASEFRLAEKWTSSAKSVFQFKVAGAVAWSTHAGIPWLWQIREQVGKRVHFWPFDGWEIPWEKSAIVEVYPSIFRHRYEDDQRTGDEQDAYSIARWLKETSEGGHLDRYLQPPLTDGERKVAELEGWILGIA
jgi:hypothetical protein